MFEISGGYMLPKSIKDNAISEFIFSYDLNSKITRLSQDAVDFFGFSDKKINDFPNELRNRLHPYEKESFLKLLSDFIVSDEESFSEYFHMMDIEGNYGLYRCKGKIYKTDDGISVFAGSVQPRSDEVTYDPVSGLQTVSGFGSFIERLNAENTDYMVLMVKIRHLFDVSSIHGYEFGNKLLYRFLNSLREMIRDNGNVYRIDRAEFCFVISGKDTASAEELYITIREAAQRFELDGSILSLDVEGILWCVSEKCEVKQILSLMRAMLDTATFEEKNELIIYDDKKHKDNARMIELVNTVRDSIINNCEGFYLCYQPLVSTVTGKIIGAEALIRWKNDKYGEVSPFFFIPYIESKPCFYELGLWIIKRAVSDAKKIKQWNPDFFVNVNISYSQLQRKDFKEAVFEIIDSAGFPPESLQLELTERCQNLDINFLRNELAELRRKKIKIALDDYGTGSATPELLCNIPLDSVKVDKGFILHILEKESNQVIVDSAVKCCERLNMDICFEGVETKEIKDFVEQYPASYHQGYYYSKPVEYDSFIRQMDKHWENDRVRVIRGSGKLITDINSVYSVLPGGFFVYLNDDEERIICANEMLLRMFECDNADEFRQLTNNSFRGIVYAEDYERVSREISGQIESSEHNLDYVKYRIKTKSGKIKWVHDYGHLVEHSQDTDAFYVFLGESHDE